MPSRQREKTIKDSTTTRWTFWTRSEYKLYQIHKKSLLFLRNQKELEQKVLLNRMNGLKNKKE